MRLVMFPYKLASQSGKALSESLNAHRVRADGEYRGKEGDVLINWGNSNIPEWWDSFDTTPDTLCLNFPQNVGLASNKWKTLESLRGIARTVEYTQDRDEATEWVNQGGTVYARGKLKGHSGAGITVCKHILDIPEAPLYTKGVDIKAEYRVHVFQDEVILYTKKRRRYDDIPTEDESFVRSLGNGWVHSADNLRRLERVEDLALDAIWGLGLDFGAVDIVMDNDGEVYVLEVNTALGMSDRTLRIYTEAILNFTNTYAS